MMKIYRIARPLFSRRQFLAGLIGLTVTAITAPRFSFARPENIREIKRLTRIYGDTPVSVLYRKPLPLQESRARYPGFHPSQTLLKAGSIRRIGARALPCDIVFERDVALKMRDGTTIYTDIFRPAKAGRYPALVAWSPYGKEIGAQWLDDVKDRSGVPLEWVSELQKFEGPDPAFWCREGYVVLNPDPRGAYKSEGNISYWGRQLAEDGYDFIEWAAGQPWCSGKIGMAGNSWLAISQWFIAAEQPPHLAAIAPWEGFVDHFRDSGNRGGIPAPGFPEMIIRNFAGENLVEDQPRMIVEHQLMDAYWEDKKARLERVNVPAYVVASFTNPVHTHGTFTGFREIASKEKWLRVNNTNEWLDFYTDKYAQELLTFFDHYLKGQQNGWGKTPRVRICVLDDGHADTVDQIEKSWPPEDIAYTPLYLGPHQKLNEKPVTHPATISYLVETEGKTEFHYVFDQETEIVGYMKLRLWVEARGSDDMELEVRVEKRGRSGTPIDPLSGDGLRGPAIASGLLRVSHRALDNNLSTASEPYLRHTHEEKLRAQEIVPVEIGIWPMALRYHSGEQLVLTIAAHRLVSTDYDLGFGIAKIKIPAEGETFMPGHSVKMLTLGGPAVIPTVFAKQQVPTPKSRNAGLHVFHYGGPYDSYLLIPHRSV
jgi:predicted acyl esterase